MTVLITDVIEAPIDRVWAIVADFGGLMRWHPQVIQCETIGSGINALRTVHFPDWWATERLERLDPREHIVDYQVIECSRPQNIGVKGSIALTSVGAASTRIDWVAGLDADNEHAEAVNAALKAYYPTRIGHLKAALGLIH